MFTQSTLAKAAHRHLRFPPTTTDSNNHTHELKRSALKTTSSSVRTKSSSNWTKKSFSELDKRIRSVKLQSKRAEEEEEEEEEEERLELSKKDPLIQFNKLSRALSLSLVLVLAKDCDIAFARLEGQNNPELLPKTGTAKENKVIDCAGYLTTSEVARLKEKVDRIESMTGVKVRVLAQAYPETPGLAIKEYWGVDDDTVVFVADPGLGNILNFSVGANVDLEVPPNFWTKLANKYGTKFYWEEKGESQSILNAVDAIESCLSEPSGRAKCTKVLDIKDDDGLSEGQQNKAFFGGKGLPKLPLSF